MQLAQAITFVLAVTAAAAAGAGDAPFTHLQGNPDVRSASAMVVDADGRMLYGKDVNTVRPIASITKLMTAMVVLDAGLDLDQRITVTPDDRDHIRRTGSRLDFGASLTRQEMLLLALMSSENRAAAALGRTTFHGGTATFVEAMNRKALSLGMRNTRFADAAGLDGRNVSTAADLAKMLAAAEGYPLIAQASTTPDGEVRPFSNRGALSYVNSNRLVRGDDWNIGLSKTGYLHEAGRCLVMQANIRGEDVSIVLLNAYGKLTPFGDSNRLRQWLLRG